MKKTVFRLNFLTACISLGIASQAWAGHTYFGISYQYYRDFAENKGKFTVGAQNIEVYNKKGELVGTSMTKAPMIDFSVVSRNGVAALVGDQYIVSVAHNGGYNSVNFGAEGQNPDQHRFSYQIVKRNNYKPDKDNPYDGDYHMPRLHKFVTDAEPIEMTETMHGNTYADHTRYPERVRIGAGRQWWRTAEDQEKGRNSSYWIASGYQWRTAGNTHSQGGAGNGTVNLNGDLTKPNDYGPLPIAGSLGDSGSPMFIYDAKKQKWLINGVLQTGNPFLGAGNGFQLIRKDWFYDNIFAEDLPITFLEPRSNGHYSFTSNNNGTGTVTQTNEKVSMPQFKVRTVQLFNEALKAEDKEPVYAAGGVNAYKPRLNNGKNISFIDYAKGEVTFTNNINQGAGGLYFEGDFTVSSENNATWQGAGVHVSEGSTVTWKVNGVENDRLSKIGKGTLHIQAKGKNLGSISVGDGKVILDQQADENNQKQAFKEVGIVSGRATVQLNSADQVDPNNIYFGFRGGRLDLNGNSLTFKRIQNTDEGAMLVNHNATQASEIIITGSDTTNNQGSDLTNKRDIAFNGWFGDKDDTKNTGRLNVNYNPLNKDNHFLLSGGTNLKGNITQNGGNLIFSGRPTPHAYNHLNQNHAKMEGSTRGEVIIDDDWINRTFTAENFQIQNGQAVVSRNVSAINGNWQLSNNAKATFGVTPNQENLVCIRSDWTGLTECKSENLTEQKTIDSLPRTKVNGNVHLMNSASAVASGLVDLIGNVSLAQNSQFTLSHNATQTGSLSLVNQANATVNNARLIGNVTLSDSAQFNLANSRFSYQISGTESTTVNLENANWTMSASTTLGSLALNNSEITLNPDFVTQVNNSQFNTLTINGNLSGNGTFNYRTYLTQYLGDKLQINGRAQGDFKLNVHNTGAEPTTLEQLTLVTLKQAVDSDLNFTLANQHVDAGAWRYELIKKGNEYRLYNPIKEQELTQNLTNEAQKLSELLAKKTALTEKRHAQEEKERSKRSVLSEALPDQSYLNTLKTELAALQRNQNAAQEVQNQKEMALTQAQATVKAAQEKAQTATNAYESVKSLETAQALDEANIALATALVKKEEAQIEFATAKLTQLNLAKQQQEKAFAVAEEEKVLSEKGASLQAEKQAFYFMVLSLEEVKEELIITEELLRQAQANNAELKAKKALLERDLEEQANQNKEAQTFKTTLAETQKEKAIVAQEKAKAAEQNNSSLSALNLANQAVIAKQQEVENLKNSTNVQAQALTAEKAKVEQDKTQAEHHKANAQQRQTVEQTMPVTAQFRQEEAEKQAQLEAERQRQAAEEQARLEAERQRQAAEEQARLEAERQRQAAEEQARLEAERQRQAAEEQARLEAERQRQAAEEQARLEAERQRQAAEEQARLEAERQRQAAEEQARLEAERQRQAAEEQARLEAERQRQAAEEQARLEAEKQRQAAEEQARLEAERQRQAAEEQARLEAERQRQAAEEQARLEAERQRQAEEEKRLSEAQRKQKELISRYSNSALSELSATVNSMLSVQHELDKVLVSDSDLSVWTNITQDKKRYDSDDFRAYQQNMNLRQIGAQKKVENGRMGAIFSHGRANNTFDEQISNHMDLTMVSAFAQYQWHDWQLGINAGYGVSSSKISGEQSQKIHRRVMSYGFNANYQFRLGELGVQPYLGVNRHFIEGENYQYEGVNIQTPKIAFNSYTTGAKVDYTLTPAQDVTIKPYFSVNYVDASNARVQTKVNQATLQQQFGRYWQKELGVSGEISHFHMSVYATQSQGSQLSKQRTIGVKLGYRW